MKTPILILVGGLGTRLYPFTKNLPKSLVPVNGKPFIFWQLTLLREAGFSEVVLCLGYMGNEIKNFVGTGKQFGLSVTYSSDGQYQLGTGGALTKAAKEVDCDFAVMYGDSYLPTDFSKFEREFFQSDKSALMTICKGMNSEKDECNIIYKKPLIVFYSKKDFRSEMNFIDYGLCFFKRDVFSSIERGDAWDLSELILKLAVNGELIGSIVENRFYEVGSWEGIARLELYLNSIRQQKNL